MSIGPGEILILAIILIPVLGVVAGIAALVYFTTKSPRTRCRACGLPNALKRQPCPRCGVIVG